MKRIRCAGAMIAALAATVGGVSAQAGTTPDVTTSGINRIEVEAYFTHYWLDTGPGGGGRLGQDGAGLRLTFRPAAPETLATVSCRDHLGFAVFGTATPNQNDQGFKTLFLGGEASWLIHTTPISGFLLPFVDLGAGGFRITPTGSTQPSNTHLAIAPGAGGYFRLTRMLSVRGDLRVPVVFAAPTLTHFEASIGLAFRF